MLSSMSSSSVVDVLELCSVARKAKSFHMETYLGTTPFLMTINMYGNFRSPVLAMLSVLELWEMANV
eukprot:241650-Karenia_brevis.AAC.1